MGNLLQQHLNLGGYQIETEGVDYAGPFFSASRQKALHPVQDEISPFANIRTTDGVVRRAFSKICPLPA
ncbi:hypothetical protein HW555_014065, partial [Spodoptera exigua]